MKTLQIFLRKSKATIFFSVLILLSAFLISATEAPSSSEDDNLFVDWDSCIGCGICEEVAPACFVVIDDLAYVLPYWRHFPEEYTAAQEDCPCGSIFIR